MAVGTSCGFPRPDELRQAEWTEFDLEGAVWSVPASRAKMRREHLVLPGYGISGGESRRVEQRPISENTLNVALRRMGYTADEMTSHGFRATLSTLLNESGRFSADAIERALAHQDDEAVRRAYNRGDFWQERVAMAQWWADEIDRLREGGKVIPLARA